MEQKRERLPERHENKYWINPGDLASLKSRLDSVLAHDEHVDEDGHYFVRSLYFDDVDDSAYYDKVYGNADRDKYRIRIYNLSDEVIFLERKRKVGNYIQKSAAPISKKLCEALIKGNPTPLLKTDDTLLHELYLQMRLKLLRPKVLVDYWREAYVHPVENTRITFDTRLATCPNSVDLFSDKLLTIRPIDDSREIVEVKFDRYLPDFLTKLMSDIPMERSAISKYVLCRRFEPLN